MAKAKEATFIETASEKYRRLKNESFDKFVDESFEPEYLQTCPTEDVTAPSGMPFKVRRADLDFYTIAGTMPMHLANKVNPDGTVDEKVVRELSEEDSARLQELSWRAVFFGCVEPRVVVTATEPDHIEMSDVSIGDRMFLTEAITRGGKEAERLANFRRKRR
jgi:hypothetical protein